MKIALSLHGLFDSVQDLNSKGIDGYNHIKNNILNKGDVDVYIHSWETDKQKEIEELYNPKKSIFEPQIDFTNIVKERKLDKLPNTPRKPEVILSHLYSVTEAMKLVYESKINYDLVIKARFDLGRINRLTSGPHNQTNPYPVQCINLQTDIEKNKLYMADWQYFKQGPADMWFYGSYEIMSKFKDLYNSLHDNMYVGSKLHDFAMSMEGNPGDLANAVIFYKFWMLENGLWKNKLPLKTFWE